jgi:hypothetical protein
LRADYQCFGGAVALLTVKVMTSPASGEGTASQPGLLSRVSALEEKFERAEKKKRPFASGTWNFDHRKANETGMIPSPLGLNGLGSTDQSKRIRFTFPTGLFDEPPEVHVCVCGFAANHPKFVVISEVKREYFELTVEPMLIAQGQRNNWQHLVLTWFAVPKGMTHHVDGEILDK